jgi:allophanate hydrolase
MRNPAGALSLDLTTLARLYQTQTTSPEEVAADVLARIRAFSDPAVWIHLLPEKTVRKQAQAVADRLARGEELPLYGVPYAVKDNIDVVGCPTTAACPAFAYVAERSAPVIARLEEAGALLVGKTNLDQFATGLAGERSPYGACRNVFDANYVSGGSSSGSAVAVAAGLVSFALGTDTAGSGRVPAGCNNIVGLKPAAGRLDATGLVPACRSLDCVSVLALTADDAFGVFAAMMGEPGDCGTCPSEFTFAAPRDEELEFFRDADQQHLFAQALSRLEQMGGRRRAIDFWPLQEVAGLLYEGPWVAERLAGLSEFVAEHAADMLPVTRSIIQGAARYSAADLFKALATLEKLRKPCATIFREADVLVVPTMPTIPKLADVEADSVGWGRRLGYYTNFVNLLRWAAVAVPSGFTPRGLPGGISLIGPGGSERRLSALAMAWQRRMNLPLGATGKHLPEEPRQAARMPPPPAAEGHVRVAVAGAHLRGQPLHPDLQKTGARFVRACRTARGYRFVALMDLKPPRPGLLRDPGGAGAIAVELYDLPMPGFGKLVASVAPPLAIGTVELEDGEAVKGFLCESWAAASARDITEHGGWVAFLKQI